MADLSWGEVVGGGVTGLLAGIGATLKALKSKANGNGHVAPRDLQNVKDMVSALGYAQKLTESNVERIQTTLDRHDGKLDDIRDDLSKIMAAVDRRSN